MPEIQLIAEQPARQPAINRATARHIPTNRIYAVILEIPGVGVELEDTQRHTTYATWANWNDGNIWSRT